MPKKTYRIISILLSLVILFMQSSIVAASTPTIITTLPNISMPSSVNAGQSITASWNSISGATGYTISLRDLSVSPNDPKPIDDTFITQTSYTIPASKLIAGHSYKFWVGVTNAAGTNAGNVVYFSVTAAPKQLTSLQSNPTSLTVGQGQSINFVSSVKITGYYSDGTSEDLTWQAGNNASMANTSIAQVGSGNITGISAGSTTLTVSYGGKSVGITITVTGQKQLTSLQSNPTSLTVGQGQSINFVSRVRITGYYSDGTSEDLTWQAGNNASMANTSIAQVGSGNITGISAGSTTLTVSYGGKSVGITITVTGQKQLTSLQSNPTSLTVGQGQSINFVSSVKITGYYSDGTSEDLTWQAGNNASMANTSIAQVGSGNITGISAGSTTLTVSYGGKSVGITITVTGQKQLTSLQSNPTSLTVGQGQSINFVSSVKITGYYSDGTSEDLTWQAGNNASMANTSIAQVGSGNITGISAGSTTLTVSYGGKSVGITITVTGQKQLTSLQSNPTSLTVGQGQSINFVSSVKITGYYSDGTSEDLTWQAGNNASMANTSIAQVGSGNITGISAGSTTLTVSYGGKSVGITITVTAAPKQLTSLTATPNQITLYVGQQLHFTDIETITGTYSDGSTDNSLAGQVTCTIDNPNIATVSNGVVTGVSAGSTTLRASYQNQIANITVQVKSNLTPNINNPVNYAYLDKAPITISWDAINQASYFKVSLQDQYSGPIDLPDGQTNDTKYVISADKLEQGHQYKVIVTAFDDKGNQASSTVNFNVRTIFMSFPNIKSPLSNGDLDLGDITVQWDPPPVLG
ncbi:hypothetical protein JCM15765_24580 [Paradesulfitobacterium aromaticivorans]